MSDNSMTGQVAIVTGAARGFGMRWPSVLWPRTYLAGSDSWEDHPLCWMDPYVYCSVQECLCTISGTTSLVSNRLHTDRFALSL